MKEYKMTTALGLVIALGAYCPFVKIQNELAFNLEIQRAKRRKRPMAGRGNYGASLQFHFDETRAAKKRQKR
jgi:hypothetical protein